MESDILQSNTQEDHIGEWLSKQNKYCEIDEELSSTESVACVV